MYSPIAAPWGLVVVLVGRRRRSVVNLVSVLVFPPSASQALLRGIHEPRLRRGTALLLIGAVGKSCSDVGAGKSAEGDTE